MTRLERIESLSAVSPITGAEEQGLAEGAFGDYFDEHSGVKQIGQPLLNGLFPVGNVGPGVVGLVTFAFIDPQTLQPVMMSDTGAVFYEVKLSPESPFTELGFSTVAEDNFSLPFEFTVGFEPLIQATPFDTSGNPIIIPGVDGENVAVGFLLDIPRPVPEPSTLLLFSLSVLLPVWVVWGRATP
jgi:hypothetical protein